MFWWCKIWTAIIHFYQYSEYRKYYTLWKKGLVQIPHFKNQFWPVFMWDKKKRFANVRQNVRITRARIIAALLQKYYLGLKWGSKLKKKFYPLLKDCPNYETFCYTYCYFYSSWLCWGPKYKEFVVIVCFFKVSKPDIIQNILRQIFSTEHFELFREIARRYL